MKNDHSFQELAHESSTDPEPNQKKYQRYEQGRPPTLNLQQQQQRQHQQYQHQYHGQKQLMAYQKPIYSEETDSSGFYSTSPMMTNKMSSIERKISNKINMDQMDTRSVASFNQMDTRSVASFKSAISAARFSQMQEGSDLPNILGMPISIHNKKFWHFDCFTNI